MGLNAYYTGVKGYAEKMWEWEAVRRPYVLERMVRNHEGHDHKGMGGKMLRGMGRVLGLVGEGEKEKDMVGGEVGEVGEVEEGAVNAVAEGEEEGDGEGEPAAAVGEDPAADDAAEEDQGYATDGSEEFWDAEEYERGSARDVSLSGSDW